LAGKVGYTDCNGETWVLFDANHYEPNTSANIKLIAQAPVLAEMIASIVNNAPSRGPLWHGSKEINEASKTLQDAGYYD
jgi:hypothetical protein